MGPLESYKNVTKKTLYYKHNLPDIPFVDGGKFSYKVSPTALPGMWHDHENEEGTFSISTIILFRRSQTILPAGIYRDHDQSDYKKGASNG